MKKINRRKFLSNVCPAVAMSLVGVSFLESCSKDSDGDDSVYGSNTSGSSGFTVEGNNVEIELNHPSFAELNSKGWMNFTAQQILILKISDSSYRAFTNSCPHQGVRNSWSYDESDSRFVCGRHGNSYPSDCTSSGTTGNILECYNTVLAGQKLQITKS
jgi:nitrite reductase/ring-hydroxylating ferredoxin subunit